MENLPNEPELRTRTYFLLQGQHIHQLYLLLNSNLLLHHLRRWISLFVEITMYLFFLLMLTLAMIMPTNLMTYIDLISLPYGDAMGLQIYQDDFTALILVIKFMIVILSLPFLLFGRLLARNRKKNKLIRQALETVAMMKDNFDRAITELKL